MLGIAPTALALKDSDLAAYHGVEHKAIAAYEQDTDAAQSPKEHDRCGSNLIAPMLLCTLARQLRRSQPRPGRAARSPAPASASAASSLSVEIFAWSERHRERPLARRLHAPGLRDAAPVRDA